MTSAIIEAINLTKIYPKKRTSSFLASPFKRRKNHASGVVALNHVNLKVGKREIFGLLGPNGAGKTTLIKIFCSLILPTEGSALMNGYDVVSSRLLVLQNIGVMLPELRGFYWRLTGLENLEIYARLYGIANPRLRAREVLKLVGLNHIDEKTAYQKYSSGMKQKLSLAKALLHDPPILLLDEPTLDLDVQTAMRVRLLIKELNKEQYKTILLTTHNMHEAEELCSRVAVINRGKIVAIGSASKIKKIIKLKSILHIEVPSSVKSLKKLQGIESIIDISYECKKDRTIIRIVVEKDANLSPILQVVSRIKVYKIGLLEPSLEEAFLKLTGGN